MDKKSKEIRNNKNKKILKKEIDKKKESILKYKNSSQNNSSNMLKSQNIRKQYVKRRSEVYGIIIIMFSVLFFLSFFNFGQSGLLTSYINDFFSFVFGIVKYIVAFLLFVWGISFFIHRVNFLPSIFGLGFLIIYISISGLMNVTTNIKDIFDPLLIKVKGGIVGAGIYYGLNKLVGKAGTITILIVLLIIGVIIVFRISIADAFKKISLKNKYEAKILQDNEKFNASNIKGAPFQNKSFADNIIKSKVYDAEKEIENETYLKKHHNLHIQDNTINKIDKTPKDDYELKNAKDLLDRQTSDVKYTDVKQAAPDIIYPRSTQSQLKIPIYQDSEQDIELDQNYKLPPVSILKKSDSLSPKLYKKNIAENVSTLNQLFRDFNLPAKITSVTRGPSITLYEVTLSQGVKVSKLLSLEDDFCVALGSPDIRFLTPIPGKSAIGIEVPNKIRSLVTLGDIFSPSDKLLMEDLLTVPLGKDFSGETVYMTINNMPHVLIAGATNSGKSVCLNSIIISLLMKVKPSQVKLIMIDPKMVELSIYNGIPHLLAPVIVDPRKAASVLSWVLEEMQNRFQLLLDFNCKTLEEYNFMVKKDASKDPELKPLPYILVIIDELADLMMVAASEVEDSICRIAQMARAVGIHLIISTQKPIVKILTGLIKTNIPARIAFKVTDYMDSRVILEHAGAEKLIGKGDMLYLSPQHNRPERLQGAFVTTKEISLITNYIKSQIKAEYNPEITERFVKKEERTVEDDELLYEALKVVVDIGHASASLLQRKLRLGYARAARIIDQLESKGYIGRFDGSKPREVLITKEELREMLNN